MTLSPSSRRLGKQAPTTSSRSGGLLDGPHDVVGREGLDALSCEFIEAICCPNPGCVRRTGVLNAKQSQRMLLGPQWSWQGIPLALNWCRTAVRSARMQGEDVLAIFQELSDLTPLPG